MTACPCAQELVAAGARERLAERGYDPEQIEEILDAVPVATHNQRGIGTLHLGCPEGRTTEIDARDLLRIVESSMSSEIYELMKRSDERAVVEKAHAEPALRRGLRARDDPPGRGRASRACRRRLRPRPPGEPRDDPPPQRRRRALRRAREILAELETGEHSRHHRTMREWLEAPSA